MKKNNLYQAYIKVIAGKGGDGKISFRRAPFIVKGGPDGGDGGRGGSIQLRVNPHMNTLINFQYKRIFYAQDGAQGGSNNSYGRSGQDLYIDLPLGCEIHHDGHMIDFNNINMTHMICQGGKGGLGNSKFATAESRAPTFATQGNYGETKELRLFLKYIADIGLVGMPNAGKSTLTKILSPKSNVSIGNYAFSTINPILGVYHINKKGIVIADLPGLVKNAHQGKGRGYAFLQHVERCKALILMCDSTLDYEQNIHILINEIAHYNKELLSKHIFICLTKSDLSNINHYKHKKYTTFIINQDNIDNILSMIAKIYEVCLRNTI